MFRSFAAVLLMLSFWGCSTESGGNSGNGNMRPTNSVASQPNDSNPDPPPAPPSLSDQAFKQMMAWVDSKMAKCGESYYTTYNTIYMEMKIYINGPQPETLTETDRLNGYEFKGEGRIEVRQVRKTYGADGFYAKKGEADSWSEGRDIIVQVTRRNGKWQASGNNLAEWRRPKCSEIPTVTSTR